MRHKGPGRPLVLVAALVVAATSGACDRTSRHEREVARAIEADLESGEGRLLAPDAVRSFYDRRDGRPAWLDADLRADAVRALLDAESDGLEPGAYHLDAVDALLAEDSAEADARLDLFLTDGLLVLGRHLRAGKVDGDRVVWTAGEEEISTLSRHASRPRAAMAALRPDDAEYAALREGLARLRERARRKPEDREAAAQLDSLVATMERRRWQPRKLEPRRVVVDVTSFEMTYYEDGDPALRSKVIVGTSTSGTPVLHDEIEHVVLNPTWTVPRSILVDELLPKIRGDSSWLARNGFKVLEGGVEVDPPPVEWFARPEDLRFTVVQEPGPANPLGRVKFVFPNNEAVYLHDTPAGHLFDAETRAFSHGCIRVEKPLDLAEKLTGKSRKELEASLPGWETKWIELEDPVPVHLFYWTVVANRDRELEFREDLYRNDPPLAKRLRAMPPDRHTRASGIP